MGDYQLILHDFRTNFNYLYEEFKLPMTLKIHVIYDHYEFFFENSGNSMKFTNGEFTETTHSTFKISERQHNFHVNRMLGTPVHREKAMKSIVWHNTRKAGFTPPSMFKLRKSSPYGMSPNLNKDI